MSDQEVTNIEKNGEQLFRPHLKRARNFVLGDERPGLYTQIVFFTGLLITSIFGIWNTISYIILKQPLFLKRHKQVDVEAIISLRGRELGFEGTDFYNYLERFHLTGIVLWFCVLIGFIFLWRKQKWSAYIIIGGILLYSSIMTFLLGATYFVEDTTLFDKLSLLVLFLLVLIHHFVIGNRKIVIEEHIAEE